MKHALRGAVTAWLGLIALQTFSSSSASGKVASLFGDINNLVERALSPDVPLIPDRRYKAAKLPTDFFHMTPEELRKALQAEKTAEAAKGVFGSGGALHGLPSLEQYVNGGGLPGLSQNPALSGK